MHWDGDEWESLDPGTSNGLLRDMWGSSPNDLYVVGDNGVILHGIR